MADGPCPICRAQDMVLLLSALPEELCEFHRDLRRRWRYASRHLADNDQVFDVLADQLKTGKWH